MPQPLQERDQLLELVKEVSIGLQQIKQLENIMSVAAAHPNENAGQKARILADIASLKGKIKQRRRKLEELEASLHESTINSKELEETINALRIQIDSQIEEIESLRSQLTAANEQIGALNNTVDSLSSTVSAVTDERDSARNTSTRLVNELNTCYYIIADKDELKKHKIIESGFLRKTRLLKGNFDKSFFEVGDKRYLTLLPLNARNVRILTNHPESSYELIDSDGLKTIRITDPDKFWSLTNYLVIRKD